ncbi:MAG: nuclear transport factor 2 family protein [Pseudomonadota bacterium]
MRSTEDTAQAYLAAWNEPDVAARAARIAREWSATARYADPMMEGEGPEGIAAMIDAARTRFPGHAFTLDGRPDGHGPFVRFAWTLAPSGGAAVARGTDVVRLDAAGRIEEVIGFLDAGPG